MRGAKRGANEPGLPGSFERSWVAKVSLAIPGLLTRDSRSSNWRCQVGSLPIPGRITCDSRSAHLRFQVGSHSGQLSGRASHAPVFPPSLSQITPRNLFRITDRTDPKPTPDRPQTDPRPVPDLLWLTRPYLTGLIDAISIGYRSCIDMISIQYLYCIDTVSIQYRYSIDTVSIW